MAAEPWQLVVAPFHEQGSDGHAVADVFTESRVKPTDLQLVVCQKVLPYGVTARLPVAHTHGCCAMPRGFRRAHMYMSSVTTAW